MTLTETGTTPDLTARRDARVSQLLQEMTLEEKFAQLVGLWAGVGGDGDVVAPFQESMQTEVQPFEQYARHGLGQITRHYGTAPVDPRIAAATLVERQRWLRDHTRLGIPAIVHEECLTGLAAWKAASYPSPPAWGATFDPELMRAVGRQIGTGMAALGVHQGLAPVLDVMRDMRWGRVEETISEDPYVVATVATAYVQGLQSAGVIATLKHFVGYSNSRAGRNLGPSHAGRRELQDVLLIPFEMAVLDGDARSVMNSYSEIDGVPAAADRSLLTGVLRDQWGFTGTVVSDYFAIAFLHTQHHTAASGGEAAVQALTAGIDVELPTGVLYLEPLRDAVASGAVDEALVDRAVERVLRQKAEIGLLDPDFEPAADGDVALDGPEARRLARQLAEESVVLLANDGGVLPIDPVAGLRIAVVGPNADERSSLFGCYAFPNHVLPQHPGTELGIEAPTVLEAIRSEFPHADVRYARGVEVSGQDRSGYDEAVDLAASADVCIAVLGDRAGLFGRGTSGEGCDTSSLRLPGIQDEFLRALVATGTPTVAVLVTGRAYIVDRELGLAAEVQAFFPGEEGAGAIARVLSGAVNPSGRMPMSMPAVDGSQPYSYLHPALGESAAVSNLHTEPAFAFGHGLSYTAFEYSGLDVERATASTSGSIRCSVLVRNVGDRAGTEVVQLYGSDLYASVTRPLAQLIAFQRVELAAGEAATVRFDVPARQFAFSGHDYRRIVEPGELEISVRRSVVDVVARGSVTLEGPVHEVTSADRRAAVAEVIRASGGSARD